MVVFLHALIGDNKKLEIWRRWVEPAQDYLEPKSQEKIRNFPTDRFEDGGSESEEKYSMRSVSDFI
jgi:hypothetical protein